MQVYRGLSILTAAPPREALERIRHHLIGTVDPSDQYHAARFVADAKTAAQAIESQGKPVVLCGGTGLYLRSLLFGLFEGPGRDPQIRHGLELQAETPGGLLELRAELEKVDPRAYSRISQADKVRLIRALEVFRLTGKPISVWQRESREKTEPWPHNAFWLEWPVEELNRRIQQRTQAMIIQGLVKEIEAYLAAGNSPQQPVFRALGADKVMEYIAGTRTVESMAEAIALTSRQYAKRQRTWFRAQPGTALQHAGKTPKELALSILDYLASA
jgi:tRNA dimethylallyltransferase